MLKKEPVTFSSAFGLTSEDISSAGAIDVTLNCDTKLFIDPLLLGESDNIEFRKCAREAYEQRFQLVIKLLAASVAHNDKAWKAARTQLSFPEMKYTHLGYSKGETGSGLGTLLTDELIQSAKEIIDLGVTDPDLFVALSLFEDNVGADRISDMTSHIVLKCLIDFTARACEKLKIPTNEFAIRELGNETFALPGNPLKDNKEPILLVPKDVVRDLPTASDWDSVQSAAAETEELRHRVNVDIGDIWAAKTKRDKARIRESITSSRERFELFLNVLNRAVDEPYNISIDHQGQLYPSDLKQAIQRNYPLDLSSYSQRNLNIDEAQQVVEMIIEQFRQLIENNGLWRLLYNEKTRTPRHERAAQQIFFAVANSYCVANNLDLTPEANAGAGPVDFKISSGAQLKILVEIKKSNNPRIVHGYESQLETYKESETTRHAHYVIVDVSGLSVANRKALADMHTVAVVEDGADASKIWFVDGTPKESASKG